MRRQQLRAHLLIKPQKGLSPLRGGVLGYAPYPLGGVASSFSYVHLARPAGVSALGLRLLSGLLDGYTGMLDPRSKGNIRVPKAGTQGLNQHLVTVAWVPYIPPWRPRGDGRSQELGGTRLSHR